MCLYSSDDNRLNGTLPLSLFDLPNLSVVNLGKLLMERKPKYEQKVFFAN